MRWFSFGTVLLCTLSGVTENAEKALAFAVNAR